MTEALLETPTVRRRLGCFLYEGVLLFGVLMAAGLLFGMLTQQRHALQNHHALQAFLFVVLGLYFVWFWTHGGQTLAMKTWQVRVVSRDGSPLSTGRALLRYVASYLWFLPALLALQWSGLKSAAEMFAVILTGIVAYAWTSRLQPDCQFWHDALVGSRLVRLPRVAAH